MGLLDFIRRKKPLGPGSYVLAYKFCYEFVPQRLFADPSYVIEKFQVGPKQALALMLATFFTELRAVSDPDLRAGFGVHVADLASGKRTIIIQYPTPPTTPIELQPGISLPAPFFSAIVFGTDLPASVSYFVLGQSPDGGTTFRSVTPDLNGNLGRGCTPELAAFVSLLGTPGSQSGSISGASGPPPSEDDRQRSKL
jgi:hypothetical protein